MVTVQCFETPQKLRSTKFLRVVCWNTGTLAAVGHEKKQICRARKWVRICLCPDMWGWARWEVVCRAGQCHEHVFVADKMVSSSAYHADWHADLISQKATTHTHTALASPAHPLPMRPLSQIRTFIHPHSNAELWTVGLTLQILNLI